MKIAPKPSQMTPKTIKNSSKIHPRGLPETLGDQSPLILSKSEAKGTPRGAKGPPKGPEHMKIQENLNKTITFYLKS